jgi:hypothetical protein
MNDFRTSSNIFRHLVWALIFTVAVIIVALHLRDRLVPFFLTRPSINGAILTLCVMGFALSIGELIRLYREARGMLFLNDQIAHKSPDTIEESMERLKYGMVKDRFLRTLDLIQRGRSNVEALGFLSEVDADAEESRGAFVRYVLGVMVFLGLIGTFWGVLITVEAVQKVLTALEPSKVGDPLSFVTQLKSSMGGLLGGLSVAFGTSLFGLTSSVLLGFVDLQTRKARYRLLGDLDRFIVCVLEPAVSKTTTPQRPRQEYAVTEDESQGDHIYYLASQEALGQNLRSLTEVITHQSAMGERVTDSMVQVKGIIEQLREQDMRKHQEAQSANLVRQGILERMDDLGRHMERLVKEVRLVREATDDMGKAFLDRMRLEGEITNKTLSVGFSDVIRNFDRSGAALGKRGAPKKENGS